MTRGRFIRSSHRSRDILPYVRERDSTSAVLAKQYNDLQQTWNDLSEVQSKTLHISRDNVAMTSELLELAEAANHRKFGTSTGSELEMEMEQARQEVKESRQRWKVIKGTLSAVIVGSGIAWAQDQDLLEMVLDPEENE